MNKILHFILNCDEPLINNDICLLRYFSAYDSNKKFFILKEVL